MAGVIRNMAAIGALEASGGGGGGGGGGVFIAHFTINDTTATLDKTYAELLAASENNAVIAINNADYDPDYVRTLYYLDNLVYSPDSEPPYGAVFFNFDGSMGFLASDDATLMTCEIE